MIHICIMFYFTHLKFLDFYLQRVHCTMHIQTQILLIHKWHDICITQKFRSCTKKKHNNLEFKSEFEAV